MSILDSFTPCHIYVRTCDGCSLYDAWHNGELAIFEDADGEWLVCHVPSGSVLPDYFMRAIDAAGFVCDLIPSRNDWSDVRHADFLRLVPEMSLLADKHHGRGWTPRVTEQPYHPCTMNGYGERHAV